MGWFARPPPFGARQLDVHRAREVMHDAYLQLRQVCRCHLVRRAPDLGIASHIDQVNLEPDVVAASRKRAARYDSGYVHRATCCEWIADGILESERRRSGRDAQSPQPSQAVDYSFDEAIGEIRVRRSVDGEGQHGYGRIRRSSAQPSGTGNDRDRRRREAPEEPGDFPARQLRGVVDFGQPKMRGLDTRLAIRL